LASRMTMVDRSAHKGKRELQAAVKKVGKKRKLFVVALYVVLVGRDRRANKILDKE